MAKKETSRQHFVPAGYLRRFVEPNHKVGVARKADLSHTWTQVAEELCLERGIYTLAGATEQERQEVEEEYDRRWESQYQLVYDLVTDDSVSQISRESRRLIIETITSMVFRNRRMKDGFEKATMQVFEAAIAHNRARPMDLLMDDDDHVIDVAGKDATTLMREYWQKNKDWRVRTLFRLGVEVAGARFDDHIQVIKIQGEYQFITSDNPVHVVLEPGMLSGPTNKDLSLSLPINGLYRIELYPKRFGRDPNHISRLTHEGALAATEVLMTNMEQVEQASLFVMGAEESIRRYDSLLSDPELIERYESERDAFIHSLHRQYPELSAQYGYASLKLKKEADESSSGA